MEYELIGDHIIPEPVARALDIAAWHARAYPPPDYETRCRDAAERRAAEEEDAVVAALVTVAERQSDIQRAAVFPLELRGGDEAERIAADHGFSPDRLLAMRGLACSRGVDLAVVLRHALRGDLRDVVRLPEAPISAQSIITDTGGTE